MQQSFIRVSYLLDLLAFPPSFAPGPKRPLLLNFVQAQVFAPGFVLQGVRLQFPLQVGPEDVHLLLRLAL